MTGGDSAAVADVAFHQRRGVGKRERPGSAHHQPAGSRRRGGARPLVEPLAGGADVAARAHLDVVSGRDRRVRPDLGRHAGREHGHANRGTQRGGAQVEGSAERVGAGLDLGGGVESDIPADHHAGPRADGRLDLGPYLCRGHRRVERAAADADRNRDRQALGRGRVPGHYIEAAGEQRAVDRRARAAFQVGHRDRGADRRAAEAAAGRVGLHRTLADCRDGDVAGRIDERAVGDIRLLGARVVDDDHLGTERNAARLAGKSKTARRREEAGGYPNVVARIQRRAARHVGIGVAAQIRHHHRAADAARTGSHATGEGAEIKGLARIERNVAAGDHHGVLGNEGRGAGHHLGARCSRAHFVLGRFLFH